ncbi:MAG: Ni/Fe hydrogenase subunit alpha [Anaerolineales bacterium]
MTQDIRVQALARVEGEGGLTIGVEDGRISRVELNIYEPPRFFEGFLRGRHPQEVPDITARICGICPVAYQMSSVRALEAALGVTVTPAIRRLRRLLYCAEYIESHTLHIYMLQAPDLLESPSALELAAEAPEIVQRALRLKQIGNKLLSTLGGRSVHPVSSCVGGFYRWPEAADLYALIPDFEWALEASLETVRWAATLPYPAFEQDYTFVALRHPNEYAILDGQVGRSDGEAIDEDDFDRVFLESQVGHSNALHSRLDGEPYLVGPLARFNLNFERLTPAAQEAAASVGLTPPLRNPYRALQARAIELVEVCAVALEILGSLEFIGPSRVEFELRAGEGSAVTEAPRGALFHRYRVDETGLIASARIMPPTAQNLARIERDLWNLGPTILPLPHDQASMQCEQLIRAYDPCISCSVHFLTLKIDRHPEESNR